MIDIEAMRKQGRERVERKPIKTFLTIEAIEHLKRVADYTNLAMYEVIEKMILEHLPHIEQIEGKAE